jgi:hypothetical protein
MMRVSKVNKKLISQPTWAQHTLSATRTVQVSHELPAIRFSCLLQGAGPVSKMTSQKVKAFCVPCVEVSRSVYSGVSFMHSLKKNTSHKNNVTRWYRQFVETGCLCKGGSPGRPRVSDDNIERAREAFQQSPRKSVARANMELGMPKIMVWKVCKRLCFKPYKMRLVQALTPADQVKRREFCEEMQ